MGSLLCSENLSHPLGVLMPYAASKAELFIHFAFDNFVFIVTPIITGVTRG